MFTWRATFKNGKNELILDGSYNSKKHREEDTNGIKYDLLDRGWKLKRETFETNGRLTQTVIGRR